MTARKRGPDDRYIIGQIRRSFPRLLDGTIRQMIADWRADEFLGFRPAPKTPKEAATRAREAVEDADARLAEACEFLNDETRDRAKRTAERLERARGLTRVH